MNREQRTKEYMSQRARPGEVKTVQIPIHHPKMKTFKPKNKKDLNGDNLTLKAGYCPCATCNHEYMWECEDENCQCCSSTCT